MVRNLADPESRKLDRTAAPVSADAHRRGEQPGRERAPTSGTLTLTPGSVTGRSRPGCVSEIVRWFAHANVANDRIRIRAQTQAPIRRAIRRDPPVDRPLQ